MVLSTAGGKSFIQARTLGSDVWAERGFRLLRDRVACDNQGDGQGRCEQMFHSVFLSILFSMSSFSTDASTCTGADSDLIVQT